MGGGGLYLLRSRNRPKARSFTWQVSSSERCVTYLRLTILALLDGILYTALELVSKVSAHQFPSRPEGDATHISTLSALPEGSKPTPDMLLGTELFSNYRCITELY